MRKLSNQDIVNVQKRIFQNYTQADIFNNVHINKVDINHDILEELILLVEEKRNIFLTSYCDLLDYLKK